MKYKEILKGVLYMSDCENQGVFHYVDSSDLSYFGDYDKNASLVKGMEEGDYFYMYDQVYEDFYDGERHVEPDFYIVNVYGERISLYKLED